MRGVTVEEKRPCVVVADDNESLRFLTVTALQGSANASRFETIEAEDGLRALAVVETRIAHGGRVLLVSDNRMPRMTGMELVRELRTKHAAGAVRIDILTSAEPPSAFAAELRALDAKVHERPMDLKALRGLLDGVVREWLAE